MSIKTMVRDIEINGIKVTAEVSICVNEDYDFDISDWDDASDRARIKNGSLFVGNVIVSARAHGQIGYDSLGGCTLRPNNMFDSAPFEHDLELILSDNDMVDNALKDLAKNIMSAVNNLKQFILIK